MSTGSIVNAAKLLNKSQPRIARFIRNMSEIRLSVATIPSATFNLLPDTVARIQKCHIKCLGQHVCPQLPQCGGAHPASTGRVGHLQSG